MLAKNFLPEGTKSSFINFIVDEKQKRKTLERGKQKLFTLMLLCESFSLFFFAFLYTSKVCNKLIPNRSIVFTLTHTKPQALCACVDNPKKSIRTHLNFYWPLKRQIFSKSFLIIYWILFLPRKTSPQAEIFVKDQ